MGERRGTKALELWCRRITEGYPGVKVDNMTTSWRDGLAFCALIHHFRPDLIDFSSLKKEDVYHNNELAFRTAESYLGIPALLDAEDMAQYDVPDRLSILTYLSQYYQHFASSGSSPSRISGKRPTPSNDRNPLPPSPSSASPPTKMLSTGGLGRREPCVSCEQPVFLAQRLMVDRRLYHRTCFKCARCGNQLSLANYYQTETDGHYCCETCPDEETDSQDEDTRSEDTESINTQDRSYKSNESFNTHDRTYKSEYSDQSNVYNKMLSDEEKAQSVQRFQDALTAEASAFNESLKEQHSLSSASSKALSGFLSSQFNHGSDEDGEIPALPTSLPPTITEISSPLHSDPLMDPINYDYSFLSKKCISEVSSVSENDKKSNINNEVSKSVSVCESNNEKLKFKDSVEIVSDVIVNKKTVEQPPSKNQEIKTVDIECIASGNRELDQTSIAVEEMKEKPVAAPRKINSNRECMLQNVNIEKSHVNQLQTAGDYMKDKIHTKALDDSDVSVKKEEIFAKENKKDEKSFIFDQKKSIDGELSQSAPSSSLVKMRMKIFETVSHDKDQISDTNISSEGSHKNTVDQDMLEIDRNKSSIKEKLVDKNNSISASGSMVDASMHHDDITPAKSPDLTSCNETSTDIESQKLETYVPCIETMPCSNTTIFPDVHDENIKLELRNIVSEISTESETAKQAENIVNNTKDDIYNSQETTTLDKTLSESNMDTSENEIVTDPIQDLEGKEPPLSLEEDVEMKKINETHEEVEVLLFEDESKNELEEENTSVLEKINSESLTPEKVIDIDLKEIKNETEDSKETIIKDIKLNEIEKEDIQDILVDSKLDNSLDMHTEFNVINKIEDKVSESSENLSPSDVHEPTSTKTPSVKDETEYPDDLNPFCSDEEDEGIEQGTQKGSSVPPKKVSTNPFGSCSEDEDAPTDEPAVSVRKKSGEKPPRPPPPMILINAGKRNMPEQKKKIIPGPNLNPFSSDDDSDEDIRIHAPAPSPRHKINGNQEPSPMPRSSLGSGGPPSFHGSSSSLSSTISRRKKPPAPKPPASSIFDTPPMAAPRSSHINYEDPDVSIVSGISSPNSSLMQISPQVSPRSRKRRPAPAPPAASSTFIDSPSLDYQNVNTSGPAHPRLSAVHDNEFTSCSPITSGFEDTKSLSLHTNSVRRIISAAEFDNADLETTSSGDWDTEKSNKDEKNRSKQSTDEKRLSSSSLDNKSISGIWKRRKGPAPAIPLIQRRAPSQPIPAAALRRELTLLEEQQRGLEKQGVKLEEIIRERSEGKPEGTTDPETDELVLQLFELVNEKNELFRRQAELMYIRRQQRLEEEHADLEHQVRLLMARPEANKTDADKAREEQLLQRLLQVVARRDQVVAALEAERVRERSEDQAIRERMAAHRAKLEENSSLSSADSHVSAAKKEKKKDKKKWLKRDKIKKGETDKVAEETEEITTKKEKKHKKWF